MSSRKGQRVAALSDALARHRILHIRHAAELLGVSEMTVRRDVGAHAGQFAFLGGHIVPAAGGDGDKPYDLSRAADRHAKAKRRAAEHALAHIRDDDTVFFDCGTTLPFLVDLLPESLRITAVCYALNVAERLANKPNVRLVVMGGLYHPASASFSGPSGLEILDGLALDVAFLSAAGVDAERGATCAHFHEAEVKRKAMARARTRILLADASKIGRTKAAFFGAIASFDAILTEDGPLDFASERPPSDPPASPET